MKVERVGIQENPPLLQTYILPSGPSAAPLGPPEILATTSLRPSGKTRVSLCPRISTSTTEPSGIATGPSGNSRPVASTRTSAITPPRKFQMRGRSHRAPFYHTTLGQSDAGLQAAAPVPWCKAGLPGYAGQVLFLNRHPDLEAAVAGERIERLVIALEIRGIRCLQSRRRQPVIPDRVDGAADRGNVVAVAEHRVALLRDPHAREWTRQI